MKNAEKHVRKMLASVVSEQNTLEKFNQGIKESEINKAKLQFLDGKREVLEDLVKYFERRNK